MRVPMRVAGAELRPRLVLGVGCCWASMGRPAGAATMMCMLSLSQQRRPSGPGRLKGRQRRGGAEVGASMAVLLEEAVLAARKEADDGAWG